MLFQVSMMSCDGDTSDLGGLSYIKKECNLNNIQCSPSSQRLYSPSEVNILFFPPRGEYSFPRRDERWSLRRNLFLSRDETSNGAT